MNEINNPMTQLAKMYGLIEAALRKERLSAPALAAIPEIAATAKSKWQVRDILRTLSKGPWLIKHGTGNQTTYYWNPSAPPYTLPIRVQKAKSQQPSEPVIRAPRPEPKKVQAPAPESGLIRPTGPVQVAPLAPVPAPAGTVELYVDGHLILLQAKAQKVVVGISPVTGFRRVLLEDL